jgi:uncharacterized coiled-coil DUF342 family protein
MASPEIQRKVSQIRHDVDDVYDLLDGTHQLVTKVAGAQQRQGTRLEEIQQALDLTVGRLDRFEGRLTGFEGRLDRIEDTQRRQYAALDAKLDGIVALLSGNRPTERALA